MATCGRYSVRGLDVVRVRRQTLPCVFDFPVLAFWFVSARFAWVDPRFSGFTFSVCEATVLKHVGSHGVLGE